MPGPRWVGLINMGVARTARLPANLLGLHKYCLLELFQLLVFSERREILATDGQNDSQTTCKPTWFAQILSSGAFPLVIMPRAELPRYTVIVLSVILSVCCKYFSSLTEN